MRGVSRIKGDNGRGRLKGRHKIVGRNLRMMQKDEAETKEKEKKSSKKVV